MLSRAALFASIAVIASAASAAQDALPPPATAPATTPTGAVSSADQGERGPPEGRILNGHVFMPSVTVPGALVTTSFASYLLIAYGTTTGSAQVGDKLYSGTFDYAGAGAVIGYEYAFNRYLSARLAVDEIIYSGINGSSAIVVGTSLAAGGSLGVTASMPFGDTLRAGILFDAGIAPGAGLTIAKGLRTVINNCNQGDCNLGDSSGIFNTNKAITLQPALAVNWAPLSALGVTGNFSYLYVSQNTNGGPTFTGQALSLGGAVDFDFKAISSVPLGLQVVFSWTAPISGSGLQHVTDLGGGIFYTGREHLALGLQLVSRRFAVEPNVDVSWNTTLATIGLRYYW